MSLQGEKTTTTSMDWDQFKSIARIIRCKNQKVVAICNK